MCRFPQNPGHRSHNQNPDHRSHNQNPTPINTKSHNKTATTTTIKKITQTEIYFLRKIQTILIISNPYFWNM